MPPDHHPLPDGTEQQDGRQYQIHQLIRNQDDPTAYHDEADADQGRIDTEGTAYLVTLYTQQERDQDHTQQPGILHQQCRGHDHKILLRSVD